MTLDEARKKIDQHLEIVYYKIYEREKAKKNVNVLLSLLTQKEKWDSKEFLKEARERLGRSFTVTVYFRRLIILNLVKIQRTTHHVFYSFNKKG